MSRAAIEAAIPHRDPFLLLDEIVEQDRERILCRKHFSGAEDFFRGHYPHYPLVPGVLLCEAAMQAGAVLLAARLADAPRAAGPATTIPPQAAATRTPGDGLRHGSAERSANAAGRARVPVATRMNNVQFKRMVRPGETIDVDVRLIAEAGAAYELQARVTCRGQLAARFDFVCMLAQAQE
jgi:3-hydroxyacyl-[acyl-carrier-protein] dehydratase